MFGQRRRKLTAEETAANARLKAERAAASMTCQVCGRAILANTGLIAHHGYQRPGLGWQTGSCHGARALPYEADKAVLIKWIEMTRDMLARQLVLLQETEDEKHDIVREWSTGGYGTNKKKGIVKFNRGNLEEVRNICPQLFRNRHGLTFDTFKQQDVMHVTQQIGASRDEIEHQTKRLAKWRQTHSRVCFVATVDGVQTQEWSWVKIIAKQA